MYVGRRRVVLINSDMQINYAEFKISYCSLENKRIFESNNRTFVSKGEWVIE